MSFIYLCRELRQRRSQAIMVAFGIGLGLAGSWLVWVFFPSFDARSGVIGDAFAEPGVGGGLASLLSKTASLPLHTSVSLTIAALAIGLAVLGGFVAGSFGGWRTARLQPAEALRRMQ